MLIILLAPSFFLFSSSSSPTTFAATEIESPSMPSECEGTSLGECYSKPEALRLKAIAMAAILAASLVGVCLPLFSRSLPALRSDRNLFVVVKAFASGVILAPRTGYMHVLPDSFHDLRSPCLPENPWSKFPFGTFFAMLSAVLTLMVDSLMLTLYNRGEDRESTVQEMRPIPRRGCRGHCGVPPQLGVEDGKGGQEAVLLRSRIVAQVLEMGIIVHSVVIGLSMGASQNPCTIRPLVAALCFHQLFEGMGLGGCILQAEYGMKMRALLAFFFATTTPFGIALGIGLSNVYRENSPTALVVVGLLNASSAGLLNYYMAMMDLLATDFMGPKLQGSVKLQMWAYVAVLLGAGSMALMAKWA